MKQRQTVDGTKGCPSGHLHCRRSYHPGLYVEYNCALSEKYEFLCGFGKCVLRIPDIRERSTTVPGTCTLVLDLGSGYCMG
jgi:hypothetical protein